MASENIKSIKKKLPQSTRRTFGTRNTEFWHENLLFLRGTPWLTFLLLILLISCQSTRGIQDAAFDEKTGFPLDSGALVYILGNMREARPIIELLPIKELNNKQTKQMLDRTDFFAAAFFPPENARFFQLAAWGDYPKFLANMAFSFDGNWKKQLTSAGEDYWYSGANGLSIALDSKQTFIAVSRFEDAPSSPFAGSPFAEIPQGFNEFKGSSPFSCWIENPAPFFSQILKDFGVPLNFPVQQLFLSLCPVELKDSHQYEALIRMQFENAVYARGMAAVFSLAGNFIRNEGDSSVSAVFFANPPVLNGSYIDINTSLLSGNEIALLLETFLLYFN